MNQAHIAFWMKEFETFTTTVVGNGEVPSSELSIRLLRKMKRVVCCDGALQKLLSVDITPDVVVGDGDSLDCEELMRYKIPYHADKSEEYNDLQKALKYCTAKGYDNILLMGCGGLREDHFIANLSIMAMYSKEMHLTMLTEHGVFKAMRGTASFNALSGMQVSVFARSPHTKLSFTGLKYPVRNRSFNWLWEGSLNEAVGEEFIVEASDDEPVVIYRAIGS
jgi:thiamine pyrophosphokinase